MHMNTIFITKQNEPTLRAHLYGLILEQLYDCPHAIVVTVNGVGKILIH